VRILNNGTAKASGQNQTTNGNTENINNVEAETASEFVSHSAGTVKFTIVVNQVTTEKTVDLLTCYEYDIAIDANNNVTSTPKDRNE
jgi:hypothetical protein